MGKRPWVQASLWRGLEEEYAIARELVGARASAGLHRRKWLNAWEQSKVLFPKLKADAISA